jgi:hypothetical protein
MLNKFGDADTNSQNRRDGCTSKGGQRVSGRSQFRGCPRAYCWPQRAANNFPRPTGDSIGSVSHESFADGSP